ncbi:MAG: RidA family protein [Lachnospiraceae bacterium]|jgi:2-iminobutanoate/2-iminopropanoate deaminase|nr:RidA family protein [Lachnospiraceae bacterium]
MQKIHTDSAPKALGPYSQGYVSNGLVFTAGQIGINPETGDVDADDIETQAEQACKNIGEILKAAGSSYDKVLKTTCFLTDLADFNVFNGIYAKYFTSAPARSCVQVAALPKGVKCELEAVAAL